MDTERITTKMLRDAGISLSPRHRHVFADGQSLSDQDIGFCPIRLGMRAIGQIGITDEGRVSGFDSPLRISFPAPRED